MDQNSTNGVFIHTEIDERINFAMHQNDVPVVKAVQIENHTELPLKQLRLRVDSEPAFAEPWEALIDGVAQGGEYR